MKRLITAVETTMLAASAGADVVYHGFAEGNPDLYGYGSRDGGMTGVQPGVGDSVANYRGARAEGGGIFSAEAHGGSNPDTALPNIYGGFADKDLSW